MGVGSIGPISNPVTVQTSRVKNDGDADDTVKAASGAAPAAAAKVNDGDADDTSRAAPRISSATQAALTNLQASD